MRKISFLFLAQFLSIVLFSQVPPNIKVGKVEASDFVVNSNLIDASTSAIVLADIGEAQFVENSTNSALNIVFKRTRRVKILDAKGFNFAEVVIDLQSDGKLVEQLNDLVAYTFNLEGGKVIRTKLESKSVFEEKFSNKSSIKKFTFPALKVGSIIEYSYSVTSPFILNLPSWQFQETIPSLWSSYTVSIPDFYKYVILNQGFLPFTVKTDNARFYTYFAQNKLVGGEASDFGRKATVHDLQWGIKDIPAMKEEGFTTTINNYVTKLDFQLAEVYNPNQLVQIILQTWPKVSEELMMDESFGVAYSKPNVWLTDELKTVIQPNDPDLVKAYKLFAFVRDNFTCTNTYGKYISRFSGVRDIFKRRSGSVAELNILLLAMLRHENIASDPVILSLRHRGRVHPVYPLLDRFNYLICETKIDDKVYYLDASQPMLGFSFLSPSCYNGIAWVVAKKDPYSVSFDADALNEYKLTSVFLSNSETVGMEGTYKSQHGMNESLAIRQSLSKSSMTEFEKGLKNGFLGDVEIQNLVIDSLKKYEEPLAVNFDFKIKTGEDILYVNPLFGEKISKNPFVSDTRSYPIELPYTTNETYVLMMETPKGYAIEEMPKSAKFELNDGEGLFEYKCSKTEDGIQLRTKLKLTKANFGSEDYNYLRDFFAQVIKKQQEQIVYRKLK